MTMDLQVLSQGTTSAQESSNMTSSPDRTGDNSSLISQINRLYNDDAEQPVAPISNTVDTIEIGSLLDTRLRLSEPIVVGIRAEGTSYVAECAEWDGVGTGADPITAIQSFRSIIATHYWELKENREQFTRDSDVSWQQLSALIYES